MLDQTELEQLKLDRKLARKRAIFLSKKLTPIKTAFYDTQAKYKDAVVEYNSLDKEYALALFELKKRKRKTKATKPYNVNKRNAAKALKALNALPKELRDKILADVKDGLF